MCVPWLPLTPQPRPLTARNAKKNGALAKQRTQKRAELEEAMERAAEVSAPRLQDVVGLHHDQPAAEAAAAAAEAAATDDAAAAAGPEEAASSAESPRCAAPLSAEVQEAVMACLIERRMARPPAEQWIEHT